jgi:hypothetical protein
VHRLQTEAELVTTTPTPTLVSTLEAFHKDKLTLRQRNVAVARLVSDYHFNNTYQYVISREDVHLSWIEAAIADLGGTPSDVSEPTLPALGRKASFLPLVEQDARDAEAFVARWRPRLAEVGNARHRNMMQVVLGETLEQKRFFDQMLAGRNDLLGRRANGPGPEGTGNGVLPVRWIE